MAKNSKIFEPERQARLFEALSQGVHRKTACRYAGISYNSFLKVLNEGALHPESREGLFRNEVLAVEAEVERAIVENWTNAAKTNWLAGKAFLARRYPDRWGEKTHIIQESATPSLNINLDSLSDEELENLEKILAKVSSPDPERPEDS